MVDSPYFCVIILATVGYADLHPTTPLSKLFTVVYLLARLFVAFITKLADESTRNNNQWDNRPGHSP